MKLDMPVPTELERLMSGQVVLSVTQEGSVATPYSYVNVWCFHSYFKTPDSDCDSEVSRFKVICDGIEYTWTLHGRYSERYLVTIANRFARYVFEEISQGGKRHGLD